MSSQTTMPLSLAGMNIDTLIDAHEQLKRCVPGHSQGKLARRADAGSSDSRAVDQVANYMLATLHMPPLDGGPFQTLGPAGPMSLYITKEDQHLLEEEQHGSGTTRGQTEDEEDKSAVPDGDEEEEPNAGPILLNPDEDIDERLPELDIRRQESGADPEGEGTDEPVFITRPEHLASLVTTRHGAVVMPYKNLLQFSTLSRGSLLTVAGLNGTVNFAAWQKMVRTVLPYSEEAERRLYAPVAGIQTYSAGSNKISEVELPAGLYINIGPAGIGKSTISTQVLPGLVRPLGSWLRDPLIMKSRSIVEYVGFGEPNMFSRDGGDFPGFTLDLSAAMTKAPFVIVDSLKMAQVLGSGPATQGGFLRWVYAILQSWARLAQYNNIVIMVVLHYFGVDPESDQANAILSELDAVSSGYMGIKEWNATTEEYSAIFKIRRPISRGSRNRISRIIPGSKAKIEKIAKAIWESKQSYERKVR